LLSEGSLRYRQVQLPWIFGSCFL